MRGREEYVSAIVIHEIYQFTLVREGRKPEALRTTLLEKNFKIVKVDAEIAKGSADFRQEYKLSMTDSMTQLQRHI